MTTTTPRPLAISGVAVIIAISGIFNVVVGARIAFSPVETSQAFSDLIGDNPTIPDWYLLLNGALSLMLGLMYLWLVRIILNRTQIAQVLVQTLAGVNIVFGFINLPLGWVAIVINVVNFALISTVSAKNWFSPL